MKIDRQCFYEFLLQIPRDKVVSYKTLGKVFDIHPRYVARLLNQNSHPERYPCYKVVNQSGKLGGYGLGLDKKISLLERDGIEIKDDKIDKKYFWEPGI